MEEKTEGELLDELTELRIRVAQLEESEKQHSQALRELRRTEAILRSLLNATGSVLVLADTKGTILALSDEAAKGFGKPSEELAGVCALDLLPPDEAKQAQVRIDRVVRSREPVRFEGPREGRWFDHSIRPVFDAEGKVAQIAFSTQDITERKHAEEEREQLIGELREAVAKVKDLGGLVPICAWCKKIRDDKGYWHQVEAYIRDHSNAEFSHGLCPECEEELYTKHHLTRKHETEG